MDGESFNSMASSGKVIILDIRPENEFNNKSPEAWRNRGKIKGSQNIPAQNLASALPGLNKTQPVIITALGNGMEAYTAAALLTQNGFNNVSVLTTGVWGLRYQAFNSPNSMYLNDWVVDVPEENR